jgi:hypothetical protein
MIVLLVYLYSVEFFGYGEKCNKIFNELAWVSLNLQAFYQSWPSSAVLLSFLLGNSLAVLVLGIISTSRSMDHRVHIG